MRYKHKFTRDQFEDAVRTSTSKRSCMLKLGICAEGGNYRVFNRLLNDYPVDTSHFTGQSSNRGKSFGRVKTLTEFLSNPNAQSNNIRRRLLADGVFSHECNTCKLSEWNSKPIPLELDHIDGVNTNNSIHNLRLLCPNCHAQTDTYRGKNKRKR